MDRKKGQKQITEDHDASPIITDGLNKKDTENENLILVCVCVCEVEGAY